MKHSNISIFIPHVGCPHQCSFCDQRTISGAQHLPDGNEVREICSQALAEIKSPENTEIAFFGGSFTAIPRDYMTELLEAAEEFVGEGKFSGIRCSTRPDCIDDEILSLLKQRGVTAIELGAQSMSEKVLELNERGHTSADVVKAAGLIKNYGFELGLQMMTGLYGSSVQTDMETFNKLAELCPAVMRIYPVVILSGTKLAELYKSGEYVPYSFDEAVELCSEILQYADEKGIRVIKCGLHASEFVEQDMVGGFYHPAFRELCESRIYLRKIEVLAEGCSYVHISVPSRDISRAVGHKKSNIEYFRQKGIEIKVSGSADDKISVIERR
ncbi:MAG: radical SAM protein [Ruminococcus sp.]|nr:radical SAM protein [Ruminococcus sp.]